MQSKLTEFFMRRGQPPRLVPCPRESSEMLKIVPNGGSDEAFRNSRSGGHLSACENRGFDRRPLATGDFEPRLLPELEEALCQAHKMEILGQMADGLAHDFNNLLRA